MEFEAYQEGFLTHHARELWEKLKNMGLI
jgi:hypothetical protein